MKPETITILLADDDPDDRELFASAFSRADSQLLLLIACNGREALELLNKLETLPSMLVLDYNMPLLNGVELLQELKKDARYREVLKIVFSTSVNPDCYKQCMDNGAGKYIVKPISFTALVEIAKELTGLCRSQVWL